MFMIYPIDKDAFEPYLATKTSTLLSPLVFNSPSRRSPPKGGDGDANRDCRGGGSDAAVSEGRWKDLLALEGYMVNLKLVNVFAQASGIHLDQAVLQEALDELLYSAQGETDLKEAVFQSRMSAVDELRGHSSNVPRSEQCELSVFLGHVRMKLVVLGQGPTMRKMLLREQQLYQMKISQLREVSQQSPAPEEASTVLAPASHEYASRLERGSVDSRTLSPGPRVKAASSATLEETDQQTRGTLQQQYLRTGDVGDPPLLLSHSARNMKPYSSEYCQAHLPTLPGLRLMATPVRPLSGPEAANHATIGKVACGSPDTAADSHAPGSPHLSRSPSRGRSSADRAERLKKKGASKRNKTGDIEADFESAQSQGPVSNEVAGIDRLIKLGELG
jgi:hypothetical protein